jgi:hypothetical protein
MTGTCTLTETFNVNHARKLAAKVAADMHQCKRLYSKGPSPSAIAAYEQELVAMLAGGYVASYEFGFQASDGKRVLSWKYTITVTGDLEGGRSGGLFATADVTGADLFNFMATNYKWSSLPPADKAKVDGQHNINRVEGEAPPDGPGYWSSTRSYAAGGVSVTRQEFRPL